MFFYAETRERVVALTIDDAPSATSTVAILAALAAHGVPATFFVIGEHAAGRAPILRRIADGGHELGNHLLRDEPSVALGPEEFEAALLQTHAILRPFAPVCWFRPGSGWYTREMILRAARHGYRCALGSVYPFDPQFPLRRMMTWSVLQGTRPGSVVILHDGPARGARTAAVLRAVLPRLQRRGFRFVTLSTLARSDRR